MSEPITCRLSSASINININIKSIRPLPLLPAIRLDTPTESRLAHASHNSRFSNQFEAFQFRTLALLRP